MRRTLVLVGVLAVAGCAAAGPGPSSFDPHLYDAHGNIVAQGPPPPGAPECREVERAITIGGQTLQAHGTACRQPDGSWRFID